MMEGCDGALGSWPSDDMLGGGSSSGLQSWQIAECETGDKRVDCCTPVKSQEWRKGLVPGSTTKAKVDYECEMVQKTKQG